MPTGGQGLAPTDNVGRGFILRSTLPAERAVSQPHQMEVPIQRIMPGKKSGNPPGLFPTEGQEFGPSTPIRSRDQLQSLSLGGTKFSPLLISQRPVLLLSLRWHKLTSLLGSKREECNRIHAA
jgi:hypothetical protein